MGQFHGGGTTLREELREDYRRMVYAKTQAEVEKARAAFTRKCARSVRANVRSSVLDVLARFARITALFVLMALAEIVRCFLPYLWLRKGASAWLLLPAAAALAAFAWLLTLHPTVAGRTYAAYDGVYVATAVVWLWLVEGEQPDGWDIEPRSASSEWRSSSSGPGR